MFIMKNKITNFLLKILIKELLYMEETINILNNIESIVTILRNGTFIISFNMRFKYIANTEDMITKFSIETTENLQRINFENDDFITMIFQRGNKKISYTGFLYVFDNKITCNIARANKPSSILPLSFRLLLDKGFLEIQDTSDTSSEESLIECTTNLIAKSIEKGISVTNETKCLPDKLKEKINDKLEKRSLRKNTVKYNV